MITLELPYPPSINGYYRQYQGRAIISKKGREYRKEVGQEVIVQGGNKLLASRLGVEVDLHARDKRVRDLDNYGKALLDALEHAGVFLNDNQIDDLHIRRGDPVNGGCAVVKIRRLNGGEK